MTRCATSFRSASRAPTTCLLAVVMTAARELGASESSTCRARDFARSMSLRSRSRQVIDPLLSRTITTAAGPYAPVARRRSEIRGPAIRTAMQARTAARSNNSRRCLSFSLLIFAWWVLRTNIIGGNTTRRGLVRRIRWMMTGAAAAPAAIRTDGNRNVKPNSCAIFFPADDMRPTALPPSGGGTL